MYCSECKLTLHAETRYCPSCGKHLSKTSEATIATRSENASYSSSPTGEKILQSFVGSNYHYYLAKWHSAPSPQKRAGWNWAAFFLGPLWLAYRKMYKQLALYYVVVIGGLLSISLMRLINQTKYELTDSSAIGSIAGIIVIIIILALVLITSFMPFILGVDANKWYYNHSQRHIRRLHSENATDNHQFSLALTRTGGTNFLAAFITCILSVVLLIVWYIFDAALTYGMYLMQY